MKTTRVSFDRHEGRRDRRYPLPPLVITIDGAEYKTVNWSLGGFLIDGFAGKTTPGRLLTGTLGPSERPAIIEFTATVVRIGEPAPDQLAVRFNDLGERDISILERIITRRLFRA